MSGEEGVRFEEETPARRVVFGAGAVAALGAELERLDIHRALLVTTARGAGEAGAVREGAGDRIAGTFDGARLHVPVEVAAAAEDAARAVEADGVLAFGGGSAIGVAKAVALRTGLPVVAVPTTYSGSEMTRIWGVTDPEGKRTGRDPRVAPRTVVYDPRKTLGLPPATSATSGVNAIAHAVEALYAPGAGPLSGVAAEEGIRRMAGALPAVVARPDDEAARSEALLGAYLCGWALDQAQMGLHHKLAHVLGGRFDLPHALLHAILLPHVAAFNEPAAPGAMARVARALGTEGASAGLAALNRALGIHATLGDLGLTAADLDEAAELASGSSYPNPRPAGVAEIREILEAAR